MSDKMHLMLFPEHVDGVKYALKRGKTCCEGNEIHGSEAGKYWRGIATKAEEGCFDGLFFADSGGINDRYKNRPDEAIKYGINWPKHDPMPTIALMGEATMNLGLAVTMTTASMQPYPAMRMLSSLDFLTDGRIGWNIVTGITRMEYAALGSAEVDHDLRYEQAEEYLAVCHALWDGIAEDAIILSGQENILADPSKVHAIEYQGKYLSSKGVPLVLPSPQKRPVLFQAGSSIKGQSFALRHADVIFAIQPDSHAMKSYVTRLREAAGQQAVRVMFGVHIVLGGTDEEAIRKYEEMLDQIPLEASLARLSGSLGIDFSELDLDQPMEDWFTQTSRGSMQAFARETNGRRRTIREVAKTWATSVGMPFIIGSAETVAARLEHIWAETGCHGFNIRLFPGAQYIDEFNQNVLPILQNRNVFRKKYSHRTFRGNLIGEAA